jgi:hypothetical protein
MLSCRADLEASTSSVVEVGELPSSDMVAFDQVYRWLICICDTSCAFVCGRRTVDDFDGGGKIKVASRQLLYVAKNV